MDEFEKEYFQKIGKISSDFKERRRDLAKSRIKMFSASLCRQVIELNQKFDVIVGAGNSGLFMTKIAEMVYEELNIKIPPILNLPVFRFEEDNVSLHDNAVLVSEVAQKLKTLPSLNNILFIDDEIMRAVTAKESLNLILKARSDIKHLNVTILSENHFFEWHYKMPMVSVNFFAYSRLIQGLNGNIGYFVPEDLFKEISSIAKISSHNHALTLLLTGSLKSKAKGQYFEIESEKLLTKNIKDYKLIKSSLIKELKYLVKEGIEKYKSGKITFRF